MAVVEAEITRIAQPVQGVVGVAAWRMDGRGPRVLINADERFPMASTFKIGVAGAVLEKVDRGELKLDQLTPISPHKVVPSAGLADTFRHAGISVSVRNLLELMMTVSDNTATDVLMELAGGPPAVTAWFRRQGIDGVRVDRNTAGILRDFFGLPPGPFPPESERPDLVEMANKPNLKFDSDPRDTATPLDMAKLLERLFSGKALSGSSSALLVEMMERTTTGAARIRGRLPAGTNVAHKTGTIGGSLNDVGIITLPGNSGKLVVAVFIKQSSKPYPERERTIADISRALYDYYLFNKGD